MTGVPVPYVTNVLTPGAANVPRSDSFSKNLPQAQRQCEHLKMTNTLSASNNALAGGNDGWVGANVRQDLNRVKRRVLLRLGLDDGFVPCPARAGVAPSARKVLRCQQHTNEPDAVVARGHIPPRGCRFRDASRVASYGTHPQCRGKAPSKVAKILKLELGRGVRVEDGGRCA